MNMKTAKLIGKKLKKHLKKIRKQTGAALAIVSLILLVLTILIISAHYTTIVQTTSSASYRDNTQAFYVAEAGIQRTLDWFIHRYTQAGLQPSPTSPPDWSAVTGTNKIPTATANQGDALYPNRMGNGNMVILTTTDISNPSATFPTITKTGGPLVGTSVNVLTDFRDYLNATNNFTSTATTSTSGSLRGRYSVTATLLSTKLISSLTGQQQRVERWKITSVGTWANYPGSSTTPNAILASAENVAIIETLTKPFASHAICANTFNFNGSPTIDSYDSNTGAYNSPTTNKNGDASLGSFANSTGPFDRGGVTLLPNGQFDIPPAFRSGLGCKTTSTGVNCGDNYCPDLDPIPSFSLPNFTTSNGAGTNPYTAMSTPAACATGPCPNPPVPTSTCTSCAKTINGGTITVPNGATGDYSFWAQSITGAVTINNKPTGRQPGALNIFVQSMGNNNQDIVVNSDINNPVNIYIIGDFDFRGNARFNSPNGQEGKNVSGVRIYATTTSSFTLGSSGNTHITGIVYAPNAASVVNGTGDFYGVIFTDSFRKNGTSGGVHYDRNLGSQFVKVFSFVPQTQVRRIY